VATVTENVTKRRSGLLRRRALGRLTRVAANLSGLVCLTLIKLDDRQAFRRWARTGIRATAGSYARPTARG
jgi:hypothetical protein